MKKLQIIALFILTIGWFPFMWIAIWGSWHREFAVWVLCLGIILCISSEVLLEKEKQQIINAHGVQMKGVNNHKCITGEEYYKETFKNNK